MKKILVIDNESQIRKLIRQMLEPNGYEVSEASGKQNGIALFRQNFTDMVIIDSLLSQKEAMETIIELKRVSFDVAIVVMSQDDTVICNETLLAFAKPFGAVSVLAKPFKQNDLLKAIESTSQVPKKIKKKARYER